MANQEIDKIKKISIRGRFAYGLICLEKVIEEKDLKLPELESLIINMWEITNSDKLGWWQDLLIENNPKVVIGDYELFKNGNVIFEEIGFATIADKVEFEKRVEFLKKLPHPVIEIIDKLVEIANQNLFAGGGEFSESTLEPTIELIEILDTIGNFRRPKIELVQFSEFSQNNGWGNKFSKEKITKD
jgi:hypothetical protein